jgi:hypothetical protein
MTLCHLWPTSRIVEQRMFGAAPLFMTANNRQWLLPKREIPTEGE